MIIIIIYSIITVLLVVGLIFGLVMLYRNARVYNIRIKMLNESPIGKGMDLYDALPTYNEMLLSFKPLNYDYWYKYANNKLYETLKK